MANNAEAVKRAIASLFTNRPITLSQAKADLDIATKPSEDALFESSAPIVRLPSYAMCNHTTRSKHPAPRSRFSAREPPQTREELPKWKHPFGYFVTIPGTGLDNRLCHIVGKVNCSILKRAPVVAQKRVAVAEPEVKVDGAAQAEQSHVDEGAEVGSNSWEDDYESDSSADGEEGDSEGEAWSKYDLLRRRSDEDTLIGACGDFSRGADSSDEN